jgi:hypothetical protein
MPWCGYWGATGSTFWWILPLVGLVVMGLMFFVCSRRFGCMGGRRRTSGELSDVRRDVETLKDDVRKLARQPN